MKFRGENAVFGDVFRNGVRISSVDGFGGYAPGDGGVITQKFDIKLSRVIVNFGFNSGGGEKGGRRSSPSPGKDFQIEFRDVKMSVLSRIYLRVFV